MPDKASPDISLSTAEPGVIVRRSPARFLNLLLVAMLLTLHGAIGWGIENWWARGLLLAHFGIFLMWQPVWRGERQIPPARALMVIGLGLIFTVAVNWWLIATWIAILFGLIGGAVPGTSGRGGRTVSILAAVYLLAILLVCTVPHLFVNYPLDETMCRVINYILPALLLVIMVVPQSQLRQDAPVIVDLFYSVVLFLMVVALVLGSFVIQQVSHGNYLLGLTQALMVMALVLAGLSWLWNPRAGFTGIGTLLSRYLLGLGLPFEQRMRYLSELAQSETRPDQYLRDALTYLLDLPWVSGFSWISPISSGSIGEKGAHEEVYETESLRLTICSQRAFTPAVLLHLKLLMQMVGHFYETLRLERIRQQSAYTQAIYETGARLTHDVKNLLQSLRSICAAAEMRGTDDDMAFRELVQRQLPHITQRLGTTLEKLKTPGAASSNEVDAAIWLQALRTRYAGRAVGFAEEEVPAGMRLPAELFDSVADTLIENALFKAANDTEVTVMVELTSGPRLRVCDSGSAIPADLTRDILRVPVKSESGLGVGLFQAARFAEQTDYRLSQTANRDGAVCFELAPVDQGSLPAETKRL